MAILSIQPKRDQTLSLPERLAKHVQQLVDDGICRIGTRLPSVREFARQHKVSPNTAADVYDRLVAVGYIEARQRVGFFVKKDRKVLEHQPTVAIAGSDPSWRIRTTSEDGNGSLNVSTGQLPSEWRDSTAIKSALKLLSTKPEHSFTEYGDPQGDLGLRKLLQSRLLDLHIPMRLPQILLTTGASQATDLVVRGLLKPGDTAVIESPGYCSLQKNLALQGVKVLYVSRTPDGPDLGELESLAREHRPKMFFVQSVLHSPTGSTVSLSNAHCLLKIAAEFDFRIVENDAYADMLGRYAPRLAALDQTKVLYVGSFSKTLSASARVGYLCGDEATVLELGKIKAITSISGAALSEQLIFHTLSTGDYRRSLERLRNRLAQHIQLCCDQLESAGLELFCRPLGGKFVWVRHPRYSDSRDLVRQAAALNITIAPGEAFQVDGRVTPWFRLNVAFSGDERLHQFLRTL